VKAKRETLAAVLGSLLSNHELEPMLRTLLYTFEDDAELATVLHDSYVAAHRMVATPDGYVDAATFPFERMVADVRARWVVERRDSSARYIESLRARAEGDGADAAQAREHLASAIKVHEGEFAEKEAPPPKPAVDLSSLSDKRRRCLNAAAMADGISPWDFGSSTISWLKKQRLIGKWDGRRYFATTEGRALLGCDS